MERPELLQHGIALSVGRDTLHGHILGLGVPHTLRLGSRGVHLHGVAGLHTATHRPRALRLQSAEPLCKEPIEGPVFAAHLCITKSIKQI